MPRRESEDAAEDQGFVLTGSDDGVLSAGRRPVLKAASVTAGALAIGGTVMDSARAASGPGNCTQVDFVTGTSTNDLGTTTYADEGRLLAHQWAEVVNNETTGESGDRTPSTDACEVQTGGISIDFSAHTASVSYSLSNCNGDQNLMLVSYEAPCSDTSNPQWDPTQADQQVVFDTATATTQSDGSLTVHVPPPAVNRVNSYLQDAPNYTEGDIADKTGNSSVTVELGDGVGANIFEPPAIRIDTGTTVTWDWVGGYHNVVAEDGTFDSGSPEFSSEKTYQYSSFSSPSEYPYFCEPHKGQGMKGYVIVEN